MSTARVPDGTPCPDCGVLVLDEATHARFHSILSSHAWTLAILKTSHIAAHVHDRYEAYDKINSRRFDNWSANALVEVMARMEGGEDDGGVRSGTSS